MRNGENKTKITPPLKMFHQKFVLGAPEEGVNCQVFFRNYARKGGWVDGCQYYKIERTADE